MYVLLDFVKLTSNDRSLAYTVQLSPQKKGFSGSNCLDQFNDFRKVDLLQKSFPTKKERKSR